MGSTRYSTLPAHPSYPTPGTPSPAPRTSGLDWPYGAVRSGQSNSAVGLISVAQLTLGTQISGIRGITEVYNLVKTGNPNNHFFIPGND